MGACSHLFRNVANAFVTEAKACESALLFKKEMGFRRIIIEGDYLSIIKKCMLKGRTDQSSD